MVYIYDEVKSEYSVFLMK